MNKLSANVHKKKLTTFVFLYKSTVRPTFTLSVFLKINTRTITRKYNGIKMQATQ